MKALHCSCGSPIPAARLVALVRYGLPIRCRECAEARPEPTPSIDDVDVAESAAALREVAFHA
ncbi:MAG: hypothetical protein LLG20_25515 [Acidobacteriales bacterium]|nr:hypothetical protein [Terriglobales bacterium]